MTDATCIPLYVVSPVVNRHDSPLLGPLVLGSTVHLDRAIDNAPGGALLDGMGFAAANARKGVPARIQVGMRWVVERTQAGMNESGKLHWRTERTGAVVDFSLCLTVSVVTRQLIQPARARYRWSSWPTTRRLR